MCLRWSLGYDHVGTGSQQIVNMVALHRSKLMDWPSQIRAMSLQNVSLGVNSQVLWFGYLPRTTRRMQHHHADPTQVDSQEDKG